MIRVLIAADSAVARAGLESLVTPRIAVAGTVPTAGAEALARQAADLQADVLLLQTDSEALIGDLPPVATVLLSGNGETGWTAAALRSGIRAILPVEATAEEIVAAVEAAAAGLVTMTPESLGSFLTRGDHHIRAGPQPLTSREQEVLSMLAEGLGNKTIAWRLGLSEHTVKFHINSIFNKLDVSTRTEAVTAAYRRGLILL